MEARQQSAALALPLRVNGSGTTTAIWVEDANGQRVATVKNCETDADRAAFIVRACNVHDDLVGALRFILAFYEPGQTCLDTNAWKLAEASGRAALAKATGAA